MEKMKFYDVGLEKQKANAASRFRRLRRIGKAFRVLEFLVLLYVVSRFSSELSVSFKFSGEWVHGVSVTVLSPLFVFLLANAIIVTLVLGSGKLSENKSEKVTDYYDEYVKKCPNTLRKSMTPLEIPPESEIITTPAEKFENPATQTVKIRGGVDSGLEPQPNKVSTRPAAEDITVQQQAMVDKATIKEDGNRRTQVDCRKKSPASQVPTTTVEELTGEELRQKAEAFIERQRRFLMGEE